MIINNVKVAQKIENRNNTTINRIKQVMPNIKL